MKWILFTLGFLVALVLLVVVIGLFIPREHSATSQITLRQPPESVWTVVRDLGNTPAFWTDLKGSERLPDEGGQERWRQTMSNGDPLALAVTESDPPHKLRTEIIPEPGAAFGGEWIYEIAPVEGGSSLTITEDGWISNPLFRTVQLGMGAHRTLDSYLQALARRFGEAAVVTHQ